jgi:hypothetical protein
MLGLHAIAVAATYVLLRVLRCSVALSAVATAMFASSVIWVRVIQWPASGEHVAAALAATAVALAASMRWFERRSPWLLAVAAAAMAVGLLAYEKPVLIVMYVVLLRYFLLAPSLQPRAVIAQARTDWPLLATLVGVAAVYGAFLRAGNYGTVAERPGVGQMLEFLGVNWVRGTGTLVIGQAQLGSFDPVPIWLVVAAQVVLAAAVIISIRRHRSAWRAWAFLLVTWLVNMGLIGLSRSSTSAPRSASTLATTPRWRCCCRSRSRWRSGGPTMPRASPLPRRRPAGAHHWPRCCPWPSPLSSSLRHAPTRTTGWSAPGEAPGHNRG